MSYLRATSNATNKETPTEEETLAQVQSQLKSMERQRAVNRLETIVPRELFTDDNCNFESKPYYAEISAILNSGWPNNKDITDDKLISIYAEHLGNMDKERGVRYKEQVKEHSDIADSLRKQFPLTFKDKYTNTVVR